MFFLTITISKIKMAESYYDWNYLPARAEPQLRGWIYAYARKMA
jgi:hypothetical protein